MSSNCEFKDIEVKQMTTIKFFSMFGEKGSRSSTYKIEFTYEGNE